MRKIFAPIRTFSMVVRGKNGDFGVAVATAAPAVGALCPFAEVNVGAIATQSFVNVNLGRRGIQLMKQGLHVDTVLKALLEEDKYRDYRQVIGIDKERTFAFSGEKCDGWYGHLIGKDFVVAGNMLSGEEVVKEMYKSLEASYNESLEERLLKALEAGQAAGGDKRGKESAALLIASKEPKWYHNIRVDFHPDPVKELRRIYETIVNKMREFEQKYGEAMKIIEL
jgi:uncharacterized Ntn-hydrolase superfamily protein